MFAWSVVLDLTGDVYLLLAMDCVLVALRQKAMILRRLTIYRIFMREVIIFSFIIIGMMVYTYLSIENRRNHTMGYYLAESFASSAMASVFSGFGVGRFKGLGAKLFCIPCCG